MSIVNESQPTKYPGAAMRRTYQIAGGLTAEFLYIPDDLVPIHCHWCPDAPDELTGQALRRYRRARFDFLSAVQRRMGRRIVVLDVPGMPMAKLRDIALALSEPRGHG
jgi:hypothetical protein